MLLCKRQLGPKTATTPSLSAWLIACTEAWVALTDGREGEGEREGVGVGTRGADAGCMHYTVNSSLRPISLIQTLHCQAATSNL